MFVKMIEHAYRGGFSKIWVGSLPSNVFFEHAGSAGATLYFFQVIYSEDVSWNLVSFNLLF